MRWTKRSRQSTAAALEWMVECLRSGQPYDMSHLVFGDEPLTEQEMLALAKRLRRPITHEENEVDQ